MKKKKLNSNMFSYSTVWNAYSQTDLVKLWLTHYRTRISPQPPWWRAENGHFKVASGDSPSTSEGAGAGLAAVNSESSSARIKLCKREIRTNCFELSHTTPKVRKWKDSAECLCLSCKHFFYFLERKKVIPNLLLHGCRSAERHSAADRISRAPSDAVITARRFKFDALHLGT